MTVQRTKTKDEPNQLPIGGLIGEQHITVLLVSIGSRLNRSASTYYREAWNLSMAEWRLLLALKSTHSLNVGELSAVVDLDKAAVSRALALLQKNQLVSVQQTRTRGRAAIATLTDEGRKLSAKLLRVSLQRQQRLFKSIAKADKAELERLLRQLADVLADADWER
ncbi:MarR family transcriptional regulator [Bradyrhizobium liaoningense]|uniref:MarR family winged helix-turn-helix transcriptional regulator n=1 Tax=Bradyrhizobium liaoningense TaxID=43992 RepID=UPI001BAB7BE6|nr:MarR family transcriptional regulator [Bradyrhizobium liaoningense]MBR0842169.1 MarR family transcriptional regulator [Bradyrhizobium liaoningense]